MVCIQMIVYVVYAIMSNIISVGMMGLGGVQIILPMILTGVIYILCDYEQGKIANILVSLVIVLGILVDLMAFTKYNAIKAQIAYKS